MKGLDQIFKRHQKQLYMVALSITKNRVVAEDAVHDALLSVSSVKSQPNDLKAYLFRVVRNTALHLNKLQQHTSNETQQDYLEHSDQHNQIFVTQVMNHIEQLKPSYQQALIMKLFGGMTFDEIAKATESSINTVASNYRRGLQELRVRINNHE